MSDPKKNTSRSVLLVTIVVAVVLIALIWPLSQIGKGKSSVSGSAEDVETRIQPVARLEVQKVAAAPAATPGKPRDGVTVFNTVCGACHNTGVAGAPKSGDKAAWAPRIALGKDALVKSVLNGKNAMPPRGGATDLTDAEVKAAVDHIVGLVK